MRWKDRVYGDAEITDPGVLGLIDVPDIPAAARGPPGRAVGDRLPVQGRDPVRAQPGRLSPAGPAGGRPRKEQVAGLLHDISHTAFSHAVDFVVTSDEQDHHESLKPAHARPPRHRRGRVSPGFSPADFYDDSIYPLLERPLPWLCADRLDYFLRDGLACGVVTPREVGRILEPSDVVESTDRA